ncbi:MAG: SRPBCC family protein [Actinomycetota bacterium]|nr:SRPBCC family protein [Actinomycetota bacterium]
MARYTGTILTSAPAEEVYDYMADFTSVEKWDDTVTEAKRIGNQPPGKGARFSVTVKLAGRENTLEYETIEAERPSRLLLRADTGSVVSLDEITVREVAAGTELVYDARLEPKGLVKVADPVLSLLFKRLGDNAAKGLARELDGEVR